MKFNVLIYLIVGLISGALYYFMTFNMIYAASLGVVSFILLYIFTNKSIIKFINKEQKARECSLFVNNFIITLSINKSVISSYDIVKESFSKNLKNQVQLISHLNCEEQIAELKGYFNLSVYDVFLNLFEQYIYNGGDILKISQIFLYDIRQIEENIDNHFSILVKKMFELISLWAMTFVILIVIKLSLNDFFTSILSSNLFTYGLIVFFLVFVLNLILFLRHGFNLDFIKNSTEEVVKGRKNEKIKKRNRNTK